MITTALQGRRLLCEMIGSPSLEAFGHRLDNYPLQILGPRGHDCTEQGVGGQQSLGQVEEAVTAEPNWS